MLMYYSGMRTTASKVGSAIKAKRLARGLTQEELEALSGVSSELICRYERSKVTPSIPTLEKIAKALRVLVSDLM